MNEGVVTLRPEKKPTPIAIIAILEKNRAFVFAISRKVFFIKDFVNVFIVEIETVISLTRYNKLY